MHVPVSRYFGSFYLAFFFFLPDALQVAPRVTFAIYFFLLEAVKSHPSHYNRVNTVLFPQRHTHATVEETYKQINEWTLRNGRHPEPRGLQFTYHGEFVCCELFDLDRLDMLGALLLGGQPRHLGAPWQHSLVQLGHGINALHPLQVFGHWKERREPNVTRMLRVRKTRRIHRPLICRHFTSQL